MVHLPRVKIFLDGFDFFVDLFLIPCSQCFVFLWLSKLWAMSEPKEHYFRNVLWAHSLLYLLVCLTGAWLVLHKRRYTILPVSLVIVLICTIIMCLFIP